jgi:Tfp pilus assembly protein PilF
MRLSWNLGWCYFNLGRFDDARKHLVRANKLAPDSAVCKWALGSVYLKKRQFRKAEVVLAESLRIKESHLTRIALAFAYLSQGKIAEAETIHLENIKFKTRRSERYESYAAFLSDVGRNGEAKRIMRKVRALRSVN